MLTLEPAPFAWLSNRRAARAGPTGTATHGTAAMAAAPHPAPACCSDGGGGLRQRITRSGVAVRTQRDPARACYTVPMWFITISRLRNFQRPSIFCTVSNARQLQRILIAGGSSTAVTMK